jgi:predicted RNA binding protein YcfA (HicA-like mRNA interferase family)
MSKLPRVTGKQLIATLARVGFSIVRTKGSHHFPRHRAGCTTVVPVHSGDTIGPGLLTKILRDIDLGAEQLNEMLR